MKRRASVFLLIILMVFLSSCAHRTEPISPAEQSQQINVEITEITVPTEVTVSSDDTLTTEPEIEPITVSVTEPLHSSLYIPDVPVEDVICYFNEVCLDAEFVNGGDPSYLQKWDIPIAYHIHGSFTDEDMTVLTQFVDWLNSIDGFPGIHPADEMTLANLNIHFCSSADELLSIMGSDYYNMDGAVTFWYIDDAIYDATICYRSDISQHVRNSVIIEEIYNGLGPVQDTSLREDSIIYAGYSEPQELTAIDELLLKLLYHPSMECGMNAEQCEQVIRLLYY